MPDYLPAETAPPPFHGGPLVSDIRRDAAFEPLQLAAEDAPDWRRYGSAVLRYRWWIVGLTALGVLGGAAASRLLRPRYLAQATVWMQTSERRGVERGPIGADQLLEASAWVDLLKSYVVLDQVVRERRLYLRIDTRHRDAFAQFTVRDAFRPGRYRLVVDRVGGTFRLVGQGGVVLQHGAVGDSIGPALGFRWAPSAAVLPPGSDVVFVLTALRDAANRLADGVGVTINPSGSFLRLALTGADAAGAAAIVNAVATRYVAVAAELKRAKLTELRKLLNEQLQSADGNLRRAEGALEEFRVRTITLPPDPGAPLAAGRPGSPLGDFFSLKVEQDQLRRDREAIELVVAQLRDSGGSSEGLAVIGAVQRSADLTAALRELTAKQAELRALRYRYTDDYPPVRRLTDEINALGRRTIPTLAETLVTELSARQRVLASQIDAGGRELQAVPQRAIEEARLRRDVVIAADLYSTVQQRYNEARLAEASSVADVRVLDPAIAPQEPVKDLASRLIVLGLFAGLGLGLVGAVLADRHDPRVRYPSQVTRQMGLPILGVLPHVRDRKAGPDDEQVAHAIEAMRGVRLSLSHAYGANGPMLLTVSSPGVSDGKSFVSANLALAFAEAGRCTLLIDGDVRRGALHRGMQAHRKPGLTDFLANRAPLDAVTQATAYSDLHFIGAGTRFRDSPELLGSAAMVELLTRLRTRYSVILVDSPPLGSGVDPYTLGTLTGNLLLVLRTDATNLDLARTKLAMLDRLPIRLLGVVVNDVRPGGVYQHYSYLSGYETEDEGTALPTHRLRGVL